MLRFLSIAFIVILLASCTQGGGYKPTPFRMSKAPEGPPNFQQGWEDGCYTGLATLVPTYYKTFYRFKQDVSMIHDRLYYQAWNDSYNYCRQYAFKWTMWQWDDQENTDPNQNKAQSVFDIF